MPTPDEIFAAGLMAKLTGSVLKRVDESTLQQPSTGPANRIDPMAVIRNQTIDPQKQQLLQQVNTAAEMAYPLPPELVQPAPASAPVDQSLQQEFNFGTTSASNNAANNEVTQTLKSIDTSIKRLVELLESKWQTN
jgi:hypothetical protein